MYGSHKEIVAALKSAGGKAQNDAFLDRYLGTSHPKYAITTPALRKIAHDWMKKNRGISADQLVEVLNHLIEGRTYTEKTVAGLMLGYATSVQRTFDIKVFDHWLSQLEGWAEIDVLCSGKYSLNEIPRNWKTWSKQLVRFSKSKEIQKRRASLVLLCSPLSHSGDVALRETAFAIIDRLKHEKEILITKAISWLLRSMVRHHHDAVKDYVNDNAGTLPAIAVRETRKKLDTGRKTTPRKTR
jgi:3-methyladenine DNA glycosylase AlkD